MDIAMIGLGVMGRSLALNFERNGYSVAGYDTNPNLDSSAFQGKNIGVFSTLLELVSSLKTPRVILIMVPAGKPVDDAIAALRPFLAKDDIIIDGGNSFFGDTERRLKSLEEDNIRFIGMGVSGGESGALWGPSLMPGGAESAWEVVRPMFESIAAKADDGLPCVAWMGKGSAGHYVKMVHNGIEYGDMQLIAEIYDLLHRGAGISNAGLAEIFSAWDERDLRSYLIEITANILSHLDKETGEPLIDLILDEAAQKGTGKWTSQNALEVGAPMSMIHAAVESRLLSSLKAERVLASKLLGGKVADFHGDRERLILAAEQALYASKITSYAQGFSLLRLASVEYDFDFDYGAIARVWRAGCIIRASLLEHIAAAFQRDPALPNLLLDDVFGEAVLSRQSAWRDIVQTAIGLGIPMLATGASLAYFDAYRSEYLPANLTQAQRDYFGAHTYKRVDKDGVFHTEWE